MARVVLTCDPPVSSEHNLKKGDVLTAYDWESGDRLATPGKKVVWVTGYRERVKLLPHEFQWEPEDGD